jgi:hypothetical protein
MRNNVLIMDTSFLCCLLQVPGKQTCGKSTDNEITKESVTIFIIKLIKVRL